MRSGRLPHSEIEMIQHPTTPGEYRALMLQARRWAHVCLDAGELDEARHQVERAARFARLADEIDQTLRRAA